MADSFGGFPVSEFLAEKIAPYIGTGPHRGPNTAPPTPAYNGALARALLGNVTQPRMAPAPAAPSIRPGRALMPSLPTEGVGRGLASQSPTPLSAVSSQGNTGAAGLAAGIGKLGTGIEGAIGDIAAKRAQQQTYADAMSGAASINRSFLTPPAPRPFGTPAGAAPSLSPIGAANPTTPIFGQPGTGTGPMGSTIGAAGSLPTMAAGGGTQTAGGPMSTAQFLTGIKAGEGVPYSGFSPTGAIGAYGLTGDFIKQYAPGAGLPTDRASYEGNAGLQDQLATYAATQLYNKYGSWPAVAQTWLTGSPTGTPAPGNMSASGYVNKVMNAAVGAQPAPSPTGSAAYAATPPSGAPTGFASAPASQPPQIAGGQNVIPGQSNPHLPGFDPSSVSFTNTPIGQQQGMLQPPQPNALAAALAGQGDPNAPPVMAPGIVADLANVNPFLFGGGQYGFG